MSFGLMSITFGGLQILVVLMLLGLMIYMLYNNW